MRIIADLHVHSKYSRATSRDMTLPVIASWAARKGIAVVGTGDFTHPAHFASIQELLEPAEPGLFVLKGKKDKTSPARFMLTAEVSNIYSHGGRTRKIHSLIFAPAFEAVKKMNAALARLGNVASDGMPIFGFSSQDLLKIVLDSDPASMLVPAHAWTPWFSIFGSKSGFDSIEECYGGLSANIFAIETGLSSDPAMNRRMTGLDDITLLSNSDAHSPSKLGREANVFDSENMDYYELMRIIRERDKGKFLFTVEFYPQEGKYYADGHRNCGVCMTPTETRKSGGVCPVCGGLLTVGVLNRVEELADRPAGNMPQGAVPARCLVPLTEILAEVLGVNANSVKVKREYQRLTNEAREFTILLDIEEKEIAKLAGERTAEAIMKVRNGELSITPGFDGEFGKIKIFGKTPELTPKGPRQIGLF
ncbi:MAG: DNA helicase UvrD [Deltaproteobacteria bacterium]|nr:DNA helicase UvrD [Deltaproteobacteria bacterium]